ncbi:hypothetical protein [Streptomyces sp. NPDC056983]|uniref:hypothetical protein n=1 Tax=Streptomyces sp. NPDC056983 TaxID=3345987 RepID=UPI003638D27F
MFSMSVVSGVVGRVLGRSGGSGGAAWGSVRAAGPQSNDSARDGQFTDPPAGRVEGGVGDGRCHAHEDDLAEALDAEWVGLVVAAVDLDGFEAGGVGVDDAAVAVVGVRVFQEGPPMPPTMAPRP